MLKSSLKFIVILILSIAIKSNLFASNDIQISSSFEPNTVVLDKRSLLYITIDGARTNSAPLIPTVDGLNIQFLGTQFQTFYINDKSSIIINHVFTVSAEKIGDFTLPSFDIEISGQKYSVPPAELTVIGNNQNVSNETLPILEVSIEKDRVFIGQMVPVSITLFVPLDLQAQFLFEPKIQSNSSFIDYMHKEKPEKTVAKVNDIQKQLARFKQFIVPIKNGDTILQYEVGLAIKKPRSRNKNRALGNPFLHLMDEMMVPFEEIEIESDPINLSVFPLPTEGKLDNFTGAIGQFTLLPLSISAQEAQIGDPLILKMEIQGTGNLDRITPPVLATGSNWKTYPPKSSINTTDPFGYTGSKVFEYIIIPQSEEIMESPNITFSFFDPQSEEYTELIPEPIPLKIAPATYSWSNNNTSLPFYAEQKLSEPDNSELLPIKLEITYSQKSLTPLISQDWLILTMIISTLLLYIFSFLYKKIRLKQKDSTYIKAIDTQKKVRSNLQKVTKAYSKQNAIAFYDAATMVIQEIVARQHSKSAQALTMPDILDYFSNKSFTEDSIAFIKVLFNTADLLKFSGFNQTIKLSPDILKKFENLIQNLEQ